ncbi:Ovule protein [Caenorhabditis elegans]|uniref:Ovule protein n=1 Tax=Caenorhabditis elegans TaxID=6239 RepID=Q4W5T1_CAEEL|nr:Ovule protein [Caenorhabditis elegans]CCD72755.1 Ovule protein [Caenorhabditis elegans]|eukprot:NP_001022410.2 Uncharacterized protein CELE_Y14H12A.2 [Caenorhabditis elegans]
MEYGLCGSKIWASWPSPAKFSGEPDILQCGHFDDDPIILLNCVHLLVLHFVRICNISSFKSCFQTWFSDNCWSCTVYCIPSNRLIHYYFNRIQRGPDNSEK